MAVWFITFLYGCLVYHILIWLFGYHILIWLFGLSHSYMTVWFITFLYGCLVITFFHIPLVPFFIIVHMVLCFVCFCLIL